MSVKASGKAKGNKKSKPQKLARQTTQQRQAAKRQKAISDLQEALKKQERTWPQPETLDVNADLWQKTEALVVRAAFLSRVDFKDHGYRGGIIRLFLETSAKRGCHFDGMNAGITSKMYFRNELPRWYKRYMALPALRPIVQEFILKQAVLEINSTIPYIRKPKDSWRDPGKPEFVRLYIVTSPVFDGPMNPQAGCTYGEEIARRLQEIRHDVILLKEGGDRLPVQDIDQVWMMLNQVRNRLPSEYYSTGPEREIRDRLHQVDRRPDLVIVGGRASAVYKPEGERLDVPYLTLPAGCRLEGRHIGENQLGMVIVEVRNGTRYVRMINFNDLVRGERRMVTGIKKDAGELHRRIVNELRDRGALTIGLLHNALGGDRAEIEEALKFLVEPRSLQRITWPGLHFDPLSREYDFHLDWFQERHRYELPDSSAYVRDGFLFFGCLHAGYTTTDYQHFVAEYPKIITGNNVQNLCGVGDFVAGLHHDLLVQGEIMGSLNYTDQEVFAGELVATVMLKVFRDRLAGSLSASANLDDSGKTDAVRIGKILDQALVRLIFIPGNHDDWQRRSGNTPLEKFRDVMTLILNREIVKLLATNGLPVSDVDALVRGKLLQLESFNPTYVMPGSGITLGMCHPGMARAQTTSLRAQQALAAIRTQVVGLANFHVATAVHEWNIEQGQRVSVEAPTQAISTAFERGKMKRLDFGPVYLEVLSHMSRIYETEVAYFNKPLLKEPCSKSCDVEKLKSDLGLYRA